MTTLNLNTFGKRILKILAKRQHKNRIQFAGDCCLRIAVLALKDDTLTQSVIDGYSLTELHAIILDTAKHLRLDRCQERKRTLAVECSLMVEMAVSPLRGEFEPTPVQATILALAEKRLKGEVMELLMAGYSIGHIGRTVGVSKQALQEQLTRIRAKCVA